MSELLGKKDEIFQSQKVFADCIRQPLLILERELSKPFSPENLFFVNHTLQKLLYKVISKRDSW
jgi:hypothetical protein